MTAFTIPLQLAHDHSYAGTNSKILMTITASVIIYCLFALRISRQNVDTFPVIKLEYKISIQ